MKLKELIGKRITVMGLGTLSGGIGTVKFLIKQGAKVLVTDLKTKEELTSSLDQLKNLPIEFILGKHRKIDFINTDLIIRNPAVRKYSSYLRIAKKNNIPIESDASLFFQFCPVPIIGVTGTKGKSTTVAILEKILKSSRIKIILVGFNKISVLDRLELIKKNNLVLFELSSWRLEELTHLKLSPHIAIITNIVPDHLNTYQGMNEYIQAKKNIFRFQTKNDYLILNKDNLISAQLSKQARSHLFMFSTNFFPKQNGVFIKNNNIYIRKNLKENLITNTRSLKLIGKHNLENVLAAITCAKILKVKNSTIIKALFQFKGLPDRLELIKSWHGIKFYNDTTATIPDAVIAALNSFSKKVILIAGGQDKGLNYSNLTKMIEKKVKLLVLLPGTATEKLIKYLKLRKFSYFLSNNLPDAFKIAYHGAKVSDIVLFSPGAASFNLFKNEFDRGEQFKKLVKNLS